ncbi:hypothetical protein AAF712_006672 [Marasmius tenuissimus]|uniref:Uncharacterized protein n=1 Tax=Marasmius tenuissimus TaxID=585030 RepID=A0ABR2ZYW1_9AGAR
MSANKPGESSRLLDAIDNWASPVPKELDVPRTPLSNATGTNGITPELLTQAREVQFRQQMELGSSPNGELALLLSKTAGESKSKVLGNTGGFSLNYDHETPIRSIDVGGADQAQRVTEFVTKGIDNASHGITVSGAMQQLNLQSDEDILPGLDVHLMRHQIIGVAWMVQQEKGEHKGGILADDMGLGKTVQMIATMAVNQPGTTEKETSRTTLIVLPAALLQQWKEEIETKTNGIMTVHVHHGTDKLKKTSDVKSKDVVITTYQTLCMDFGLPKNIEDGMEEEWLAKHGGVLARTKFYRVIADEAQYIRNRATRASITMTLVRAKYRWILTGTPVTNTLADIYGLLRFGRFRPWNDWNDFNSYVCKVQTEDLLLAGSRAQQILKPVILRRTKNSQLEGKPLLELPPKHIEIVTLEFCQDERDLYDNFENYSRTRINKFINEGTLIKNHHFILVLILRLRQMCCHPNLILAQAEEYDDPTMMLAGDADKERARALKAKGREWVERTKERFIARAYTKGAAGFSEGDEESSATTCPRCDDPLLKDKGRILDCGHEICSDCAEDLRNAPIDHNGIFGYGSEKENIEAERRFEEASAKGWRPCPTNGCRRILDMSPDKLFKSFAFEPTDDDLRRYREAQRKARQPKKKIAIRYGSSEDEDSDIETQGKTFEQRGLDDSDDDLPELGSIIGQPAAKKRKVSGSSVITLSDDDIQDGSSTEEEDAPTFMKRKKTSKTVMSKRAGNVKPSMARQFGKNNETLVATWAKGDDDLEPSAKMLQLMEYLKEWELIGDKTIVYSQWTSMLDLVETLFSRHGIRSVRFDGSMDRHSRESALSIFKSPIGPKVILISTKCGGVGLNLVAANRVVNLDLSWNYAAESQAYDRAHRIGQEKEVFIQRLVVKDTIEERMLKLQEVKTGLAELALGEGTGAKLNKLSMKDIKFLFAIKNPNEGKGKGNANPNTSGGRTNLRGHRSPVMPSSDIDSD